MGADAPVRIVIVLPIRIIRDAADAQTGVETDAAVDAEFQDAAIAVFAAVPEHR